MKTLNETKTEECIDLCNKMLRGERSAVKTFENAIAKFQSQPGLTQLRQIRDSHRQSVSDLEQQICVMGGAPDSDSGAWGTFASLAQNAANLFGEESAVNALESGEEKGLDDYREALKRDVLTPRCKELYTGTLIPRVEQNLVALDRIENYLEN